MNKTLFTLVKYDYLQRIRSYRFLIILCASLAFASALIPTPDASYSTISIGNFLGHYNSAWIAYVTAIMSSVFVSLLGYYIINNSIRIDQTTKVGQLVAATNITNFHYLISKFLGNVLILFSIIFCIFLVGIILFFARNTGYDFEINHFLEAYILIPLPTIIFVSAVAILLEVVFKKRSTLQNIAYFFLFTVMVAQSWTGINRDPFGVQLPTQEMVDQVNLIDASEEQHNLNIGFVIRQKSLDKRFEFTGPSISLQYASFRLIWPLLGILIIFLTSWFFHRFELNEWSAPSNKVTKHIQSIDSAGIEEIDLSSMPNLQKSLSIWPVFKIEFLMMVRRGSKWLWLLNIIGMALLVITPIVVAHKYVLPILWFLQVNRWADLVTKEKFHQMHYFIYSSFKPVQRLLNAQCLAGISLAVLLALPLIVRYIIDGNFLSVAILFFGALFIIGLSAFVGITTGGKRLYEILFFFMAYLNINELPYTDYFGGMHQSLSYLLWLVILGTVLLGLSNLFRRLELRRI